jgi:hypothetical protein
VSSQLRFDAHAGLRDGEVALARVEAGGEGAYVRICVGDAAGYDVVRDGRHGWRFALRANGGRQVGAFRPARVGRGGRIAGEGVEVGFRPKPFTELWRVAFPLRAPIEIRPSSPREAGRGAGGRLELVLSAPEGVPGGADSLALLCFVCWLITEIRVTSYGPSGGGS